MLHTHKKLKKHETFKLSNICNIWRLSLKYHFLLYSLSHTMPIFGSVCRIWLSSLWMFTQHFTKFSLFQIQPSLTYKTLFLSKRTCLNVEIFCLIHPLSFQIDAPGKSIILHIFNSKQIFRVSTNWFLYRKFSGGSGLVDTVNDVSPISVPFKNVDKMIFWIFPAAKFLNFATKNSWPGVNVIKLFSFIANDEAK